MIVGAILAGGAGRRIGGAKALTMLGRAPLCAHVALVLRPISTDLAVVGDGEAAAVLGAVLVADAPGAAAGPLAGVSAALSWAEGRGARWLALAPCDTPFLPADVFARLHGADAPVAFATTPAGPEPLVSVWRTDLAARVHAVAQSGGHPAMRAILADLGAVAVAFDDADAFMNINTPDDLARAEVRLAR